MSTTVQTSAERLAEIDANFDQVERQGLAHLKRLASDIAALALPRGSYVIVHVATGAYVTGASRGEARHAFRAAHPSGSGWACRVEDLPCE